jgi:epoxyqueuosine reductase
MDTTAIRQAAHALDFDLVGITTAEPPPHTAAYRQWIADGCHGDMRYMTRRLDPAQILPGCRSIIVVGLNYHNPGTPHLARYVGRRDYHDVMGEKLKELAKLVDGLWYVDTGPILERDLAQRAGLGWIGKHTNLINRRYGNWILLGEVLTKLELAPDTPEREHCGICRRCLDACPTGAITAPYRLDARRCISYLTIELKGEIPEELRAKIGDRVFGCDACLEACPWNRFAKPSAWKPRPLPPLEEMLSWTEQQFADCFGGTPLYRLKLARLLRNIRVVLGNRRAA